MAFCNFFFLISVNLYDFLEEIISVNWYDLLEEIMDWFPFRPTFSCWLFQVTVILHSFHILICMNSHDFLKEIMDWSHFRMQAIIAHHSFLYLIYVNCYFLGRDNGLVSLQDISDHCCIKTSFLRKKEFEFEPYQRSIIYFHSYLLTKGCRMTS